MSKFRAIYTKIDPSIVTGPNRFVTMFDATAQTLKSLRKACDAQFPRWGAGKVNHPFVLEMFNQNTGELSERHYSHWKHYEEVERFRLGLEPPLPHDPKSGTLMVYARSYNDGEGDVLVSPRPMSKQQIWDCIKEAKAQHARNREMAKAQRLCLPDDEQFATYYGERQYVLWHLVKRQNFVEVRATFHF